MLAAIRRQASHPFWVLVGLRLAFLLLTACTLLWSPLHTRVPVQRAYNGTTDLLFGSFDRWDAENFIYIARHGYNTLWTAAFFPLFPLALAGAHAVFRSYTVGGVLISLVAAGFGAWAVYEIARPLLGERGARDSVLYLALFPTAFVFTSPYSEGLFLALSAAAFLAARPGATRTCRTRSGTRSTCRSSSQRSLSRRSPGDGSDARSASTRRRRSC